MTIEEQLKNAIAILEKKNVTYALAGALAASNYRTEPRTTIDIDFLLNSQTDPKKIACEILEELALTKHLLTKAELDGGPLFAIKNKSTPIAIVIGRDAEKQKPGVDFLLPEIEWVKNALLRAQKNLLNFGFKNIPTMTVEDIIIAKLLATKNPKREHDIGDIRSIFSQKQEINLLYIVEQMFDLKIVAPNSLLKDLPLEIQEASKRILKMNPIKKSSKTRKPKTT